MSEAAREMTLEEVVDNLPPRHRAREEYEQMMADPLADFEPTPEHINALPAPLRKFIHDLETRCGEVAALTLIMDQNKQLQAVIEKLRPVSLAIEALNECRKMKVDESIRFTYKPVHLARIKVDIEVIDDRIKALVEGV